MSLFSQGNRLDEMLVGITRVLSPEARRALQLTLSTESEATWNLRFTDAGTLFGAEDRTLLERLSADPVPTKAFAHQHTIAIVKATRLCNLRCTYCHSWREGPGNTMALEVLARLTRDILRTPRMRRVDFVWHGGEVTILPIDYLRKAVWIQQHFARPETRIANCIQTNATRITPDWAQFFHDHRFGVGVSIDGPPEVHDLRRLTVAGKPTWRDVRRGMDNLRAADVPFGALAVVDVCVLECGAEQYLSYLADLGVNGVAFLNAIPSNVPGAPLDSHYVPWSAFADFLREVFPIWWIKYRETFEIRELQALVDAVRGKTPDLCVFHGNCMGQYLTFEPNGDVAACEKYVGDPDYVYGNICRAELNSLLRKSARLTAAKHEVAQTKHLMSSCPYFQYCSGGCPHDARLSKLHIPDADSACCGLAGLIEDIHSLVGDSVHSTPATLPPARSGQSLNVVK